MKSKEETYEYIKQWRDKNREKVRTYNVRYYIGQKYQLEEKGLSTKYLRGDPRRYASSKYKRVRNPKTGKREKVLKEPAWNPFKLVDYDTIIKNWNYIIKNK